MKFALLGLDPFTLALAAAVQQSAGHQLLAAYDIAPAQRNALLGVLDPLGIRSAWEELLHEPVAEAVIVAPLESPTEELRDRRADQLRKLVQSGLTLLLVQPACEAIVGYELEMIRRDCGTAVLPLVPEVPLSLVRTLQAWIAAGETGPLGRVEQVAWERSLDRRDPEEIRTALSRDAAVLRALVGEVRRVGALGQAFQSGGPFHLQATLVTESQILARWALQPSITDVAGRLTLFGTRGQAVASQGRGTATWTLQSPEGSREFPGDALAAEVLRSLDAGPESDSFLSWMEASRAQEVAETIERSAARGKTIELFNEELSEEGTFKGVMAVGSCGLLMLTLLVLIFGAMIEGMRLPFARMRDRQSADQQAGAEGQAEDVSDEGLATPPPPGRPLWIRLWPVYPFLIFLLLQVLNVVFVRPAIPKAQRPPGPAERGPPASR